MVYIAAGTSGLQILELMSPAPPQWRGEFATGGFAADAAVSGSTAIVACGAVVYAIDVSTPATPALLGSWDSDGWAFGVAADSTYAYVANGGGGVQILNLADATPVVSVETSGVAHGIAVAGGLAYVADGIAGLQIFDISTLPATPSLIGAFDTPGIATDVSVVGDRVCIADGAGGVTVVDVPVPAQPTLYARSSQMVRSLSTAVVDSRVIVADDTGGLAILAAQAWPTTDPLGDFNNSGKVSLPDLVYLAETDWLESETMLDVLVGNLTDDINVNLQDYAVMADNWGVGIERTAPTVINAPAASITSNSARLNGEVTDNGNEDPTVTVYWGDNDGGTTPGNWDNADTIGTQGSTFYDDISSLSPETTYYFRAYAVNSMGGDWADSTASFDTTALPAVDVKINFQPSGSAVPSGYLADTGATYGDRGNGYSYGWDGTNDETRDRGIDADQRYDTLNHMQKDSENHTWEIEIPNGAYDIVVVFGDPGNTDQTNHVKIEGVLLQDPDGEDNFDVHAVTVTVSDGKLTLSPNLSSPNIADNAKVCYIDIATSAGGG
ncbi:MAG: hypothetical protein DRP66_00630 [Planctomycetota bacterium]|nr:MAG: hypothetical protein DRP66_00630 [Planctomycetota bacterium]